ncbi:MAG: TrmB family transcriptional regulator [Candidatus Hodarchaeota archaeon]
MTTVKSNRSVLLKDSNPDQLLNLMTAVGLSLPQARIYLELVKIKESTAGDLCKATGVKDSRIYSILTELEQIGLIMVQTSTPKLYMVVPLTEGLQNLQERLNHDFNQKKDAIKELNLRLTPLFESIVSIPSAIALIVKGRKNIINKIHHELSKVEKEVLIRFPNYNLYFEFEPLLLELQNAGVRINAGMCQMSIKKLREEANRIPELALTICQKCCDCFYLMVDQNYLLSVSNWNSPNVYAIWTSDTSLINITTFFSSSNVVPKKGNEI